MIRRVWESEWGYVAAFVAAVVVVVVLVVARQAWQTKGHDDDRREANTALLESFQRGSP